MGSYSIRAEETELAALVRRAEAGEEVVLSRDGQAVAMIIPFPVCDNKDLQVNETKLVQRRAGQNFSGLAGTDLSWLDEPLPEDMQRAFGMIDEVPATDACVEQRPYGQNFGGIGRMPDDFDDPLPEEYQRAFGMID